MATLLALLLLTLPVKPENPGSAGAPPSPQADSTRYVFAWRGVPVGTVTLKLEPGRFTYVSQHLHTRAGKAGARRREQSLEVDAQGQVRGSPAVPQALWLWKGVPAVGCVVGREELTGREGPHCVTRVEDRRVEGTLLGTAFQARYGADGRMEALEVGDSRFTVAAPGERLRAPPELFADGLLVEGARGALSLEPPLDVPARLAGLTPWKAAAARALAAEVHAAFPEKTPGGADWSEDGEGEAGGCLAHALRFAAGARARGVKVALVHGLLVVDGGPARPHAWVRVALAKGGTLDLDPTSLDEVSPHTHLPIALAEAQGPALEAGARWLSLLRGAHRVVRRP
ncbi:MULTISPECIES: lasso peptide biosynthesis protein [unclassified Myxococcus]|uniref:lasso peptide biosynthesis protein n=1 Tax=Myxococcus TaxID=32 RepID=UPI001144C6C6|nr:MULTISPECIES: lasso peptide biosynthesis protein [unclassified Myxococcus]NOK02066.1 transglutaminase domain-containing protein [Myxococcus xanthus]